MFSNSPTAFAVFFICHYLSVMQKLRIINEIVSEVKTNFTFDEIINHLPHKNGSMDIDETRLS